MGKHRRKSRKRLTAEERAQDASRWLKSLRLRLRGSLLAEYAKRYGSAEADARLELMALGYYDRLCIEDMEAQGISWEYLVEPLTGESYVVREGTELSELYTDHASMSPWRRDDDD